MDDELRFPEAPTQPTAPSLPGSPGRPTRKLQWLTAVGMSLALFAGVYALIRWTMGEGQAGDGPAKTGAEPKLFLGWAKPDFVLVISGQNFGYLQPCGCSHPQYGGLARRWEFINSLKKKEWNVVPIDVGDLYSNQKSLDTPNAQNLLKYETAMRALHVMGYHVVGIGHQELTAGLGTVLPQYSLNNPRPRPLAANLAGVEEGGNFHAWGARSHEFIEAPGLPKIGVAGAIGKSVQEVLKADTTLTFVPKQMAAVLAALKQADFNVVLFQTAEKQPLPAGQESEVEKCVKWCAQQTALHVVIHTSDDPEPPFLPTTVGDTQLITVGHKGKYVGVLGVWKKDGKYETKYQPVLMGPEYDPKPGNPVSELMEAYAKRVMKENLIAKYLQTPHRTQSVLRAKNGDARYVGSAVCGNCHEHAHDIWTKKSDTGHSHSHAFKTLEKAKDPSLRQFDGECVQCHTTGFKHDTGYNDKFVRANPRLQTKLLDVGCESCHGPGSAHTNDVGDVEIRKLMNPWAKAYNKNLPENVRLQKIDNFCQTCHDIENDVHWNFDKKWPLVIHMNSPAKGAAAKGKKK